MLLDGGEGGGGGGMGTGAVGGGGGDKIDGCYTLMKGAIGKAWLQGHQIV